MMSKGKNVTAGMSNSYCTDCGWPVVWACCNGEFMNFKDAANHDWWYYCSNKGCKNHDGEGKYHNDLGWAKRYAP